MFSNFGVGGGFSHAVVDTGLSDHLGQIVELSMPDLGVTPVLEKFTCRPITGMGRNSFFSCVEMVNWHFIDDSSLSADKKFALFVEVITGAFESCFPEKTYRRRSNQSHTSGWFSSGLRSMRDTLEFLSELNRQSPSGYLRGLIKEHKRQYKNAINRAKSSFK